MIESSRPSPKPEHDRPETYPAYRAAPRIQRTGRDETALVGIKHTGFDVYFQDGQVLHYDLEGRLLRLATPNVQWRRGLSGRVLKLSKRTLQAGGGLQRIRLDQSEVNQLLDACSQRMRWVSDGFQRGQFTSPGYAHHDLPASHIASLIRDAAEFTADKSWLEVQRFRQLYGDIPIMPPDQYSSLALMATEGCRYNKCTFCGFYRGAAFRNKTPEQFRAHLADAVAFHGQGLALRRAIFLGQANALMGPRRWREEILQVVNEAFEFPEANRRLCSPSWWKGSRRRFEGITSFLDAFVGERMSEEEFAALRKLNLHRVFVGMETGDTQLLEWLRKPADPEQMLLAVRAARSAGVSVGVIVLVGAGGEPFYDAHVSQTVQLILAMQLGRGDFVYLSPLIKAEKTEYEQLMEAEHIQPLSPQRMAEQERQIRAGLKSSISQDGPYVSHYEVENFLY